MSAPTLSDENERQLLLSRDSSSSTLLAADSSPPRPKYATLPDAADNDDPTIPQIPSNTGRTLTWSSAYILTISRIVGSGIFATPGPIYSSLHSIPLTLLVWIIGATLAFCGLAISMELGCMLPRSGGHKVYLEYMYQRPRFLTSTVVAVHAVLLGFTASNCVVFGEYVLNAAGFASSKWKVRGLAVGLLTGITVMHGCFLRTGIVVQNALGWVKIALMGFMALLGLVALFWPHHRATTRQNLDFHVRQQEEQGIWAGANWDLVAISTAIFKVSYSFAGYDNVNNVLNEVKNPVRTLKTMAPTALLSVTLFYLMVNIAYFIVVPLEEIEGSGELIAALFFQKLFGVSIGSKVLSILVAISAAGNVMVVTFSLARLNQEIARSGFLPFPRLLSSSKPFNAPLGGLIVHYIPSLLVIVLPPQKDVYAFILDVEGYPGQFIALAICIGTLLLRRREPDLKRPFKAWSGAIWLRLAMSVALIAAPFFPPGSRKDGLEGGGRRERGGWYATYAVVGGGILLFGILYWYIWTVLLPRIRGYSLEEEKDVRDDGTTVTRLVRVRKDQ